ncbi:MAG: 30S ribosomal protein S17 [Candidatus Aenigmatarchaeota archaeon]
MNIGINAKEPKGVCDSDKCPWHGHLKIRGRIFVGVAVSTRATNTAIVEWNYYKKVPKYERYERRKTRIAAHLPKCILVKIGDKIKVAECRSLSKMKKFVVVENME